MRGTVLLAAITVVVVGAASARSYVRAQSKQARASWVATAQAAPAAPAKVEEAPAAKPKKEIPPPPPLAKDDAKAEEDVTFEEVKAATKSEPAKAASTTARAKPRATRAPAAAPGKIVDLQLWRKIQNIPAEAAPAKS